MSSRPLGRRPAPGPTVEVALLRPGAPVRPLRVLLLHGLASSGRLWDAYAERTPDWVELWCAELPWGAEGDPRWAEDPDVVQWVTRALELVPGGSDVVVAHSFGANVLLAALDRVDRRHAFGYEQLRAAILVSPFYRPAADLFDWATIDYYLNDFDRILEDGLRVRSDGRLDPELQREMALRVRDRVGPYGWVRFFDTYLRTASLAPDRFDLPTLVVAGGRDTAAFPADAEALAEALAHSELRVLVDSGHFAMAESPDSFATIVNDFLDRVAAGPAPVPGKSRLGHRPWERSQCRP